MEDVVRRSNAYAEAGADTIFVMALNEEEVSYYREKISAPLVGIFATIEPLPISVFEKVRYEMVIGSLVGLYATAKGLLNAYTKLKETGDWNAIQDEMINDEQFFDIVGIKSYGASYRKFRIG